MELDSKLKDPEYALFYSIDQDKDDFLGSVEWSSSQKVEDSGISYNGLYELFKEADENFDSNISFQEFSLL